MLHFNGYDVILLLLPCDLIKQEMLCVAAGALDRTGQAENCDSRDPRSCKGAYAGNKTNHAFADEVIPRRGAGAEAALADDQQDQ